MTIKIFGSTIPLMNYLVACQHSYFNASRLCCYIGVSALFTSFRAENNVFIYSNQI